MSTKYKAAIEREQSDARIDSAEREQARPKLKLRITGECKQNMKLCKRRGLFVRLFFLSLVVVPPSKKFFLPSQSLCKP